MLGVFKRLFGSGRSKGVDGERTIDGVTVRIDRTPMVVSVDAPSDIDFVWDRFKPGGLKTGGSMEPTLLAKPPVDRPAGGMVSAALLAQKAKQIDDGLYAAVELAADAGAGKLRGKGALLAGLVERLASAPPEPAVGTVLGAASIGTAGARIPEALTEAACAAVARFEGNPLASKPLGFYNWSADLARIFKRDRMLQQELEGAAGIAAIVAALRADAGLGAAYAAHLDLAAKLTNALVADMPDLRGLLAAPGKGAPARGAWFLPPSRAHETDLAKRMYGDRPIPDGLSLMDEVLRRVRTGTLDLAPKATSGWYDWQTWALETLGDPRRAPEAKKLRLSSAYNKCLEELFRGVFALNRETHVKQLELPAIGAAMRREVRRVIVIRPDLRVEPVPTFYLRRALGYRFVHGVLEAAFGEGALSDMRRMRAEGPVKAPLAAELRDVEALFLGAYAAGMADLGLPPDADPAAAAALPAFLAWRGKLADDPDLSADVRMMVPLFYDVERSKTKVLAFLGWAERRIEASFATPPRVEVREPNVDVTFGEQEVRVAYPVTVELYVSRLLDRSEMRAICDAKKTRSAIVTALEG